MTTSSIENQNAQTDDVAAVMAMEGLTLNPSAHPIDEPLRGPMTADEAQTLAKAIEGQELAFLMYDNEAGRHDWEQLVAHMDDDWKAATRIRIAEQTEAWKEAAKEQYQRLQDDQRRLANGYRLGGRSNANN